MRKLILLILATILLCSAARAETLVVWFSCTGNTEALAHTAAEALNADLWQIIPEKPYSDEDLNYHDSSCRANREQADPACRSALLGTVDVTLYDSIVLAYPIWWGEEPRIVDTWIESVDLAGKQMAAICTSGGSGIQTSYAHLQEKAPDALWLGAERFSANTTPAELSEWCASIGLEKEDEVKMRIEIGDPPLTVRLADNGSAAALKALLANGPVALPASYYPYEEARLNSNGLAFHGRKSGELTRCAKSGSFLLRCTTLHDTIKFGGIFPPISFRVTSPRYSHDRQASGACRYHGLEDRPALLPGIRKIEKNIGRGSK